MGYSRWWAALPLLPGSLDFLHGNHDSRSWAYPVPVWAFVAVEIGLALSHFLVAVGYAAMMRATAGWARRFAVVGLLGTILVGGCELWSAGLARADKNGSAADALNTGYGICSIMIIVGSIGAGVLLLRRWRPVGLPLLVGGLFLLVVVTPTIAVGTDTASEIFLTLWSLSYVWLGLGLNDARSAPAPARSAVQSGV